MAIPRPVPRAGRSILVASVLALTASIAIVPLVSAATDRTPPTVTAPVVRLKSGFGVAFGSSARATITFTGYDTDRPYIDSSPEFAISRNRAAYVRIKPGDLVGHTGLKPDGRWAQTVVFTQTFAVSATYRVRARMRDRAGNWSPWTAGPLLSMHRILETSGNIRYSSGWTHVSDPTSGTSWETASAAGETATLTFTARSIAWLSNLTLDHGTAEVRIDGVLLATVDLSRDVSASGASRRAIFSKTWTSVSKHILTITVLGTAGHPQVDVDGFLAIS
jgi:hypothetical protein